MSMELVIAIIGVIGGPLVAFILNSLTRRKLRQIEIEKLMPMVDIHFDYKILTASDRNYMEAQINFHNLGPKNVFVNPIILEWTELWRTEDFQFKFKNPFALISNQNYFILKEDKGVKVLEFNYMNNLLKLFAFLKYNINGKMDEDFNNLCNLLQISDPEDSLKVRKCIEKLFELYYIPTPPKYEGLSSEELLDKKLSEKAVSEALRENPCPKLTTKYSILYDAFTVTRGVQIPSRETHSLSLLLPYEGKAIYNLKIDIGYKAFSREEDIGNLIEKGVNIIGAASDGDWEELRHIYAQYSSFFEIMGHLKESDFLVSLG